MREDGRALEPERDPFAKEREEAYRAVEKTWNEFRGSLEHLHSTIHGQFDLRRRIRTQPLPWLVGGLLFGLWLGRRCE